MDVSEEGSCSRQGSPSTGSGSGNTVGRGGSGNTVGGGGSGSPTSGNDSLRIVNTCMPIIYKFSV